MDFVIPMGSKVEAEITIGGVKLTPSQAMTIRMACINFGMSLIEEGLGEDMHGKKMTSLYLKELNEINHMIMKPTKVLGGNQP